MVGVLIMTNSEIKQNFINQVKLLESKHESELTNYDLSLIKELSIEIEILTIEGF